MFFIVLKSMAYQYMIGVGVIASLLGFLFLYYNSRGLRKTRTDSMEEFPVVENCVKKAGNGEVDGTITDIIIVGAGVAGAALANSLGKISLHVARRRRVRVIERDLNEPDRIAGEGLLPGGYVKLMELGLKDCADEIDAQRILGHVLCKDGKDAKITFPPDKLQLHVTGRTFHYGRFVQGLWKKATSLHNVTLEQGTVTSLLEGDGTVKGVHYKSKSGQELTAYAPLAIVCDGAFSNLRRSLCYPKVDVPSYFVGFILENCKLPNENVVSSILAYPSIIVIYPISSTEIRCLVDVPSRNVPSVSDGEMAHYLKTRVAPKVPPELHTAFISAIEKKNNVRIMENRIMPAAPHSTPGALLMGDAFNMRHPITAGGMTVALSDVAILRDLLRPLHNLHDASAVCKYLESFYTLRKAMASTINILANTLHKVFTASSDPAMGELQQACFGYLRLGGVFSDGLAVLMSGLYPRPLSLAFHLLALAIYGFGRLLLPFPSTKRLWSGAKLVWVASGILVPLIKSEGVIIQKKKSEGVRQTFFPLTVPAYYRAPRGSQQKR